MYLSPFLPFHNTWWEGQGPFSAVFYICAPGLIRSFLMFLPPDAVVRSNERPDPFIQHLLYSQKTVFRTVHSVLGVYSVIIWELFGTPGYLENMGYVSCETKLEIQNVLANWQGWSRKAGVTAHRCGLADSTEPGHMPFLLQCPFEYVLDNMDLQASEVTSRTGWRYHLPIGGLFPHYILCLPLNNVERAKGCCFSHFDNNVVIVTIINK